MMNESTIAAPPALRAWYRFVGTIAQWSSRRPRANQRGLSQSTENAVLLTGAVGIAITVIALVSNYVSGRLAGLR